MAWPRYAAATAISRGSRFAIYGLLAEVALPLAVIVGFAVGFAAIGLWRVRAER